jgi:hypothetical protein
MIKTSFGSGEAPGEHDRIAELLHEVGEVEPPMGLVREVMARVAQIGSNNTVQPASEQAHGGAEMTRKVLWGVAVAAVVVIGVMRFVGFPQVNDGVQGTIGAAKRYQAEQISSKDVKLQDAELQTLLQSDAWAKVTRDKAAWSAITNKDVQRVLAASGVQAVLANQAVMGALADQAVQQALATPGVVAALSSQAVQQALASQAVQQILASQGAQAAMASSAMQAALATPGVQQALSSQAFMAALNSQAFVAALANQGFYAAMASQSVQAVLASQALMNALGSQAFMNALANQGFVAAISSQAALQQALNASQAMAASQLQQ